MLETNRIELKSHFYDDLDIEKEVISFLNYREGGVIPRNKELMRVFHDVEMVEALGSGMPVILRKYGREAYNFMPHFIRLTLPIGNRNVPKLTLKNVTKNDPKNVTKKRREAIVKLIKKDNTISLKTIAEKIGVVPMTIKRELAEMRHIVQHVGPTNGGHWEFL